MSGARGEHAAMHCTRRRVMDGSCLLSPLGGREEALARLGRKRRKEGSKEHDFGQPGKGAATAGERFAWTGKDRARQWSLRWGDIREGL